MNNMPMGLTRPETRSLKEYVTWYQVTMERIACIQTTPVTSQISFVASVIATKRWTSYWALASVALFIDLVFATCFRFGSSHFGSDTFSFLDCFYVSTLIFTSLGIEGIKPITPVGQLVVIAEVIIGYIVLAFFVFLLARKVEWKY